jgi:hypothetical protein
MGTVLIWWHVPALQRTGRASWCASCDRHFLDDLAVAGRGERADYVGGCRGNIQPILRPRCMGCRASLPAKSPGRTGEETSQWRQVSWSASNIFDVPQSYPNMACVLKRVPPAFQETLGWVQSSSFNVECLQNFEEDPRAVLLS